MRTAAVLAALLAGMGLLGCASRVASWSPRSVQDDGSIQQYLAAPDTNLRCCAKQDSLGRCVRNASRRALFVRMTGGPRPGLYANHIVPIRCGGCDVPSNFEWMDEATWKARTGPERHDCGRHVGGSW